VNFRDPWGLCEEALPDNAGFWTGFWSGFADSLSRQADSLVGFYGDIFTGNWDKWHADSALGQADSIGGATQIITYSAVGVSATAMVAAFAVQYSNLPPSLKYAVLDVLLNGFDMTGGNNPVYPDPSPSPPIEGPLVPGN
jgi:hypothetical protein